jgi:hypothetical protein
LHQGKRKRRLKYANESKISCRYKKSKVGKPKKKKAITEYHTLHNKRLDASGEKKKQVSNILHKFVTWIIVKKLVKSLPAASAGPIYDLNDLMNNFL